MPPIDDPYGDEPTEDELRQMEEDERKRGLPEDDDSSQGAAPEADDAEVPGAGEDDEDDKGEPKPKPEATPGEEAPAGEGEGDADEPDARWQQFLDKHKGKSPEELAKLAFQQSQRANRAEFDHRKTSDNLRTVVDRIQQARDARLNKTAEERAAFQKKIEENPDAALLEEREARLRADEQRDLEHLDTEEFNARAGAAIEFASALIPEFQTRAPAIRAFGEEIGFSPDEMAGVVDGRQIVTLHLASIAGNMIKAGIIDTTGKFVGLPEPVAGEDEQQQQQQQQQRRRGSGFGKQPARGAQQQKTLEGRLADVASMSDEDFDKLDQKELEKLLQEVEQS